MPMKLRPMPPLQIVRDRLNYDPDTGVFTWRMKPCGWIAVGDVAGSLNSPGYRLIGMAGYGQLFAHRLAWLHFYGVEPVGEIDHADGDVANNAIRNLRPATSSEQKMNRGVQSNNRSGLKGAFFHACRKVRKWRSQIKARDGRLIFLGYYMTPEEAHAAYCEAVPKYHGEFGRTDSRQFGVREPAPAFTDGREGT